MLATVYLVLATIVVLIYVIVATALLFTDFKDMNEQIKQIRKDISELNEHRNG